MLRIRFFVSVLISGALFGVLPLGQYATWADCSVSGEEVGVSHFCVTNKSDDALETESGLSLRAAITSANVQESSEIRFHTSIYADSMAEIKLTAPLNIDSNVRIIGPDLKLVEGQSNPIPQIVISRDESLAAGSSMIEIAQNTEVSVERVIVESLLPDPNILTGHAIEVKGDAETETSSVLSIEQSIIANASSVSNGAAISTPGTVNIVESTITSNVSQGDGGAISAGGDVNVTNSSIINNESAGDGGAIHSNSDVQISNTLLEGNTSGGKGGAVAAEGNVNISYSGVLDNSSVDDGGAVYAEGEVRVEDDALIDGNESIAGEGGAIKSESTVTVLFSEISNNQSGSSGGAISAPQVLVNVEQVLIESEPVLVVATPLSDGPSIATFTGNNAGINPDVTDTEEIDLRDDFNQRAGSGGAISAETVTTSQATFVSNTAIAGGAISVSSNVDVSNSTFNANVASDGFGGAIDIDDFSSANSSILNSTFNNNTAGDGGAIDGNGIVEGLELDPQLVVEGSTFSQNQAEGSGGAIYQIGKLEISNSDFNSNSAEGGDGGAIYAAGATVISDSTFEGNLSGEDGGAISTEDSVEVTSSTFNENSSGERGGAIYSEVEVAVTTSSFEGNVSLNGGALSSSGDVAVEESAFIGNSAISSETEIILSDIEGALKDGHGGAIFAQNTARIENSSFEGNSADESGGAVSSQILLVNASTFENNSAHKGGALEVFNESRIIEITENMGEPDPAIIECLGEDFDPNQPQDLVRAYLCVWNFNNVGHSVVMNSLFDRNISTEKGSAIYGPTWLLFNTLNENYSANGGSSIDLRSNLMTMLLGNLIISSNPESLCTIPFDFSLRNLVSDETCTTMEDSLAELSGTLDPEMLSLLANPYTAGLEQEIVPIALLEGLSMSLLTPLDFHSLVVVWLSELRGIEDPFELLLPGSLQEAQLAYISYFTSEDFIADSEDHVALSDALRAGELDLLRGILALVLGMSIPNPDLEDPYSGLEPTSQSVWRNASEFLGFISENITKDLMENSRYIDRAWSAGAIETTLLSPEDEPDTEIPTDDPRPETLDSLPELLPEATQQSNWSQQSKEDLNLKLAEAEKARIAAQEATDRANKEAKTSRAKKRDALRAKTSEIAAKVRATKVASLKTPVKVQYNKSFVRPNKFGAIAV